MILIQLNDTIHTIKTMILLNLISHFAMTLLIPSVTELLSGISREVGHECFNYYASLKGWMKLFITYNLDI